MKIVVQKKEFFNHTKRKKKILPSRTNHIFLNSPEHLCFSSSRYKFVSKMFNGYKNVLEVGCGDGFFSSIVKKNVKKITLLDFDQRAIDEVRDLYKFNKLDIISHDYLYSLNLKKKFDGIYSLDVLEHIDKKNEKKFLKNICNSLEKNGSLIIGMPSLESQKYASKISKRHHVNCKTGEQLRRLLKIYFHNIYMFSMNDETLHTGFFKMSHYLLALATNKKI